MASHYFFDLEKWSYDALDVVEQAGPRNVWKELNLGPDKLVFFPGAWRSQFTGRDENLEFARSFYEYPAPKD